MRGLRRMRICVIALAVLFTAALPASAQLTTGSVGGTVKDPQGAVVPGATVTLVSETRGTKSVPVVTNAAGDFVFPNIPADTYTIEVEMPSFKTLRQSGIRSIPVRGLGRRPHARSRRRDRDRERQGGIAGDPDGERGAFLCHPHRDGPEPALHEPQLPATGALAPGVVMNGTRSSGSDRSCSPPR